MPSEQIFYMVDVSLCGIILCVSYKKYLLILHQVLIMEPDKRKVRQVMS